MGSLKSAELSGSQLWPLTGLWMPRPHTSKLKGESLAGWVFFLMAWERPMFSLKEGRSLQHFLLLGWPQQGQTGRTVLILSIIPYPPHLTLGCEKWEESWVWSW